MSPESLSRTFRSAVLLDLDDTLYPERDFVRSGFRAAARLLASRIPVAADHLFDLLWQRFQSGARGSLFNDVLTGLGIAFDSTLIDELVETYRSHRPELTLFPDAARVLPMLSRLYATGILTDGSANAQRRKVSALGLLQHVNAVVYSDDFGREHWKPSPVPYLELLRRLNVDPIQAVYVGDNPKKDFIGARRLGLQTVRIRRPNTEHGDVEAQPGLEADQELATLDTLPEWLAANERTAHPAAA